MSPTTPSLSAQRPWLRVAIASSLAAVLTTFVVTSALAQTKVLKFISWQKDEPGNREWWAGIIKEFEASHPGVTIEWTKVDRGAYADTMLTLFAGGKPPDIVHLAAFEFQKFADNGWLEDLGPWEKKANLDLSKWTAIGNCTWKQKSVCVPLLYSGYPFAYNEAILKKAGLGVPTNWKEYLNVLQKTTLDLNGDGIKDQFGTGHETRGGGAQYLSEMMVYTLDAGGRFTDANGKVTIDTPQMIEGLRRWKTVVKGSLTPRDLSSAETRQMFADGAIAMKIDGPWIYPIVQKGKAAGNIKFISSPLQPPMGGASHVIGMPSDIPAATKQLVWDFIRITISDKQQSNFATLVGAVPPSPTADTSAAKAKLPQWDVLVTAMQTAAKAGVDRVPKGLELSFNEFAKMVKEEAQRMVIDDLDPKVVAQTMQKKAEALQKQQ
jgi:multiple sugar transport system substrate-binding protein